MELFFFPESFYLYEKIWAFIDNGGTLLIPIICLSVVMWTLIIERIYYLFIHASKGNERSSINSIFDFLNSRNTNRVADIEYFLTRRKIALRRHLTLIKQCVTIAPLLGLLGTVTGMIEVFEVLNLYGSSNSVLIAKGFSHATIPTMLGLTVAISGFFMLAFLEATITDRLRVFGIALRGAEK